MSEQTAKVCVWCKQDCSIKPRRKDSKGRYLCQECVEPFQQAVAARAARAISQPESIPLEPEPDAGNVLNRLVEQQSVNAGLACPSCSRVMARDAVICTHCGYNMQTGRQMRSHVTQEKAPKEEGSRRSSGRSLTMSPGRLFIILTVVFGGLFAIGKSDDSMAIAFVGLASLYIFASAITVLAVAFLHGLGQGLLSLCVPFYIIAFAFFINENAYVKVIFAWYLINFGLLLVMRPQMQAMGIAS